MAPDLVAEGVPIRRGLAVGGGRTLAEMSFAGVSDSYPFVLALPQPARKPSWNNASGNSTPPRCTAVSGSRGCTTTAAGVTVDATAGGSAVRYTAAIAVAADGVRSTVRPQLGTAVRAKDYPDSYLMGDFADTTGFGPDAALFLESAGIVESFPLPGDVAPLGGPPRGLRRRRGRRLARLNTSGSAPGSTSTRRATAC